MRGLFLLASVLSTATGYRIAGIRIMGKRPPLHVTTEFGVICWLRNEFSDACSTFRGDVRRRCVAIWFETTGQHNDDWHDEWQRRGQRASFEALVYLPDSEAAVKRELECEVDAGQQRLCRLSEEERQLEERGHLHAAMKTQRRWFDLHAALRVPMMELQERRYATWPKHHDNPAWPTQKVADALRREDAVYAQRYATFVMLRKTGEHRAASEVWEELRMLDTRSHEHEMHLRQVLGDQEGTSRSKDYEAGVPWGTTARLERCLVDLPTQPNGLGPSPFGDFWFWMTIE